jgi:hypothetical protein
VESPCSRRFLRSTQFLSIFPHRSAKPAISRPPPGRIAHRPRSGRTHLTCTPPIRHPAKLAVTFLETGVRDRELLVIFAECQ